MDTDLLRRVGEALFGERWQSALAAALGVNNRTMRRWCGRGRWLIDNYRLGGISLSQRLEAIEYSTIPAQEIEARLIQEELKRRKERAA